MNRLELFIETMHGFSKIKKPRYFSFFNILCHITYFYIRTLYVQWYLSFRNLPLFSWVILLCAKPNAEILLGMFQAAFSEWYEKYSDAFAAGFGYSMILAPFWEGSLLISFRKGFTRMSMTLDHQIVLEWELYGRENAFLSAKGQIFVSLSPFPS